MQAQTDFQGIYFRIVPMIKDEAGWLAHPYWEWSMAIVFSGLPTAWLKGSTGTVLDFDPETGALSGTITVPDGDQKRRVAVRQEYVDAALFTLVQEPNEVWGGGGADLTYGEATEALARYIVIDRSEPAARTEDNE